MYVPVHVHASGKNDVIELEILLRLKEENKRSVNAL